MAKVSYMLKNPDEKESLIFLRLNVRNKRFKISIGEKVKTKFWNGSGAKKTNAYPEGAELNSMLRSIELYAEDLLKNSKTSGTPLSPQTFKEKIKDWLRMGDIKTTSFFGIYDEFRTI